MNIEKILELKTFIDNLYQTKGSIENTLVFDHPDKREIQLLSTIASNKLRDLICQKKKELMYELIEWDEIPIEDENLDPWKLSLKELNINQWHMNSYGLKEDYDASTMEKIIEESTYSDERKDRAEKHLEQQIKSYLIKKIINEN